MSRFYASIQGSRGEATRTRQGTPKSGITGHLRGWDVGIEVMGFVDRDGNDTFEVWLTSGSNGRKLGKYIGSYTTADLEGED